MRRDAVRQTVTKIFANADIGVDGVRPWDLEVKHPDFYARALRDRNLGLGESYMDGWIECGRLDEFADRLLRSKFEADLPFSPIVALTVAQGAAMNLGTARRAFRVGEAHYDIGNDLYERMLDRRMTYTCGYWKDAATLDEAQEAKLDLTCRKIGLKPGMTVLDIGCGWGSFAKFAAERYGAVVTGLTVSKEQAALARRSCAGLPVEILLQDYRDAKGTYDHIVSLGMFEHVFHKNYRTFMEVSERLLADDGLFLLHTIGSKVSCTSLDPWVDKYIFPNASLPSVAQIARSVEGLFIIEDLHNFGADYDRTLMAWHENFMRGWPELSDKYGERFRRMWEYYLLTFAGSFRARTNQLWQIVLSKNGVRGGYRSIR